MTLVSLKSTCSGYSRRPENSEQPVWGNFRSSTSPDIALELHLRERGLSVVAEAPSALALRQQALQIAGLGKFKDAAFGFDGCGVDGLADLSFNPKPVPPALCGQHLEVHTSMLDALDSGWASYPSPRSNKRLEAPDIA